MRGRQGGDIIKIPAEFEVGDYWGTQFEDSNRQLVWGLGLTVRIGLE